MSKTNKTLYRFNRSKRAKGISLTVKTANEVLISYPCWSNRRTAEKFLLHKINWIEKSLEKMKNRPIGILEKGSHAEYKANKENARKLAHQKILQFNEFYKFKIGRIAIRNQKTRWGSCSTKNNLNFNWRIIWLPTELVDYLIVHEMCHLAQMNHSKKFWDLVKKVIPDYKEYSKKLRQI